MPHRASRRSASRALTASSSAKEGCGSPPTLRVRRSFALAEIFGIEPSSVRAGLHRARAAVETMRRCGDSS